ncbi:B12-binding domain-containing radical SAM protein [Thermodesulfobacteriota bacterium]
MKTALVTPFLSHLPLHPGSYLGYGAGVLGRDDKTDVFDFNAEIFFRHEDRLKEELFELDRRQVVRDDLFFDRFYHQLSGDLAEEAKQIPWREYEAVYITTPSWFVTVPTEAIVKLSRLVKKESSQAQVFFFGNSLGTWTDEKELKKHGILIRHLNDLFNQEPENEPVNYDALPTPVYKNREKYLFDMLPFRLKHGCNWGQCRFCSLARGWNSGYMERSAGRVIQELEELIDLYDPQMFVCRDNSINGSNLLEFCNAFEKIKKPWVGMARADLSDKEIDALQRSGCRFIYFGLESGSNRVLKDINKGINAGQMSHFVKSLYDRKIMPAPSVFVGSPGETEEDFQQTVKFAQDHQDYLDVINAYPFMKSPASDFSQMDEGSNDQTLTRLNELIMVCVDAGIKVCVGEQSAEYVLFNKIFPK